MKKQLVIVTTHFGTNFSGGSTATCRIFSEIENSFSGITVVGTQLGKHDFQNLTFIPYKNWMNAWLILKKFDKKNTIFYGDFYNSFLLCLAKTPFYFTYHDNWPELGKIGLSNRLMSLFYTNVYKKIFKSAIHCFAVSKQKMNYIKSFTPNVSLVRNGFDIHNTSRCSPNEKKGILMVGNIDERKYKMALFLFEELTDTNISIDIYGKINDSKIHRQLSKFPFVSIKGFQKNIPYHQYKLMLHTSLMENLPIVFCEAIDSGTPILAFDVGGSREIVIQGNGFLVPPYSIKTMKDKLFNMLNSFPSQLNTEILADYSWSLAAKKYEKMLTQ